MPFPKWSLRTRFVELEVWSSYSRAQLEKGNWHHQSWLQLHLQANQLSYRSCHKWSSSAFLCFNHWIIVQGGGLGEGSSAYISALTGIESFFILFIEEGCHLRSVRKASKLCISHWLKINIHPHHPPVSYFRQPTVQGPGHCESHFE